MEENRPRRGGCLMLCGMDGRSRVRSAGHQKAGSGKVREVFDLGETLLIVATDRISAFDCILPTAIPHKGEVLTQMSAYWFETLDFVPNHFLSANFSSFPDVLQPFKAQLAGRSMLVRETRPLPVSASSGGIWRDAGSKDYQATGAVWASRRGCSGVPPSRIDLYSRRRRLKPATMRISLGASAGRCSVSSSPMRCATVPWNSMSMAARKPPPWDHCRGYKI